MPTLKPSDATWYIWGTRIISFTSHTPWTWITVKWLLSVIATNQGKIPLWSKTKFTLSLVCLYQEKTELGNCICFETIMARFYIQSFFHSVPFCSVARSCLTLCDPMNCSTPGLPVHHQLPEFIQTHVHRVGDAIQPSHPLSSPSPPGFNLSQHQGLFQWVSSSHQSIGVSASTSVLPMNTQDRSPLG